MAELIGRTVGPQLRLRTTLSENLWRTRCDPHQLESALLNLCINARDAMPDGGHLTLETSNTVIDAQAASVRDMEPGEYVTISVRDTGVGMPPDVVARVFDPFFTTKPIGQGTGLGLSMVYGFTKQSHGQVRIHSQPGDGTTVRLHLPRQYGAAPVVQPASDQPATPQMEGGANILVVDDEPFVAMLITDVVQDLGCTWIDASDGATAMQAVRSDQKIDLLITDIGLPGGMNGRQLADCAREVRPELKVLFVTGYAQSGVLGDGTPGVGMQVITKPFAIEALEEKIRDMLAK
jgi:CheY-like chemotaxis protein